MNVIRLSLTGQGRARLGPGLALLLCFWLPHALCAQEFMIDWNREQVLPPRLDFSSSQGANRPHRIPLFRFQPGFLSEPVGLEDDPLTADAASQAAQAVQAAQAAQAEADQGPDWIQVSMGTDNPYFDFRMPGDPGGVGFYRVCSQMQLLDTGNTGCAVGLEAVTPAGLQYAGVENGPTVVRPALGVYHALDDGTALHGFVGKNVVVNTTGDARPLQHSIQYGMAVQRPLVTDGPDALRKLSVYVGALGRYHPEKDDPRPINWEVLPGLQWKVADNMWMSSGVILPVGTSREPGLWQLTCSLQF